MAERGGLPSTGSLPGSLACRTIEPRETPPRSVSRACRNALCLGIVLDRATSFDGVSAPPRSRLVLTRALLHLLLTGIPTVRRPSAPVARVTRALRLSPPPDRLRRLHDSVWIAATRHIPAPRPRG